MIGSGQPARTRTRPARGRWLTRLLAPLGAVLLGPLAVWVAWVSTFNALGRDQGIFQYIAWAVLQGAKDYRDVRDVNGPLIHLLHMGFVTFAGFDEQRFHLIDRGISLAVFAVAAALMVPAGAAPNTRLRRSAWGVLGSAYLFAQYIHFLYWDWAQRESFCDWFALLGLGFGLHAVVQPRVRAARYWIAAAALLVLPLFGKPTFLPLPLIAFGVLGAVGSPTPRRARLRYFVLGTLAGCVAPVAYLLIYGDIAAFIRIYVVDAPRLYAYVWPMPIRVVLELPWIEHGVVHAAATVSVFAVLLALRVVPARYAVLLALPLTGMFSLLVQRKGFPYHMHPIVLGSGVLQLATLQVLAERTQLRPRFAGAIPDWLRPSRAWGAVLAACAFCLALAHGQHYLRLAPPLLTLHHMNAGHDAEARERPEFLELFHSHGFSPWDLRLAARYVRESTPPSARVEAYSMDPYVMYLAQRRQASPFIYAYDLNVDIAWDGAHATLEPAAGELACARIEEMGKAHELALLRSVAASPPAAWILVDDQPFASHASAALDLGRARPAIAQLLSVYYAEVRRYGGVHVYRRRADVQAAAELEPAP